MNTRYLQLGIARFLVAAALAFPLSQNSHAQSACFEVFNTAFTAEKADSCSTSPSCYRQMYDVLYRVMREDETVTLKSAGAEGPNAELKHAWEKEGLFYREIEKYFDTIDKAKFTDKL